MLRICSTRSVLSRLPQTRNLLTPPLQLAVQELRLAAQPPQLTRPIFINDQFVGADIQRGTDPIKPRTKPKTNISNFEEQVSDYELHARGSQDFVQIEGPKSSRVSK